MSIPRFYRIQARKQNKGNVLLSAGEVLGIDVEKIDFAEFVPVFATATETRKGIHRGCRDISSHRQFGMVSTGMVPYHTVQLCLKLKIMLTSPWQIRNCDVILIAFLFCTVRRTVNTHNRCLGCLLGFRMSKWRYQISVQRTTFYKAHYSNFWDKNGNLALVGEPSQITVIPSSGMLQ